MGGGALFLGWEIVMSSKISILEVVRGCACVLRWRRRRLEEGRCIISREKNAWVSKSFYVHIYVGSID